jgi:serine/threonine protein kinase/tetratricopeptide (TPR) repeat protein
MTEIENQARSVFLAALERAPEGWPAFLQEACGANTELRARVEQLLHAHLAMGSIHGGGDSPDATIDGPSNSQRPGAPIGPYKLIEPIGEGGMGAVWMAQQIQPVKRLVAIKLIKRGMDSRQVIARFEAERQALALMDHPNIAKILDAGVVGDASGRPYFVMELVKGVPITKYCDEHRLTPRQRLELFIPVCHAVQHAHQKGIIHRDLKPSNVLVALYDGNPVPKVIDFGVAKAVGQPLTEQTLVTGFGAIVGTLEYMSPEQAEINQLDIDTRSDIYSLGVVLYELMAGSPPFTRRELEKAGLLDMLRVIREQEPSKPSTKLSTAERLPALAANRGTEPAKLARMVRGELDWIVMKALEKDRNRRYETAGGLATDLQRYLADEPVQACPPSVGYRLRKFGRKHRSALLTAATVVGLLIAGLTISIWQAARARRAEKAALTALDEKEQARAAEAEQRRLAEANEKTAKEREAESRAVLDFLENHILAAARPEGQQGGLGHEVTLRRALVAALPFVETSFDDQPLIEARLRMTIGWSFISLGEWQMAVEQYEKAHAIRVRELGSDHPETLRSAKALAGGYNFLERYGDALPLLEETLAGMKLQFGPDHEETLSALIDLASSHAGLGRTAEALKLREETLALQKAKLGRDHSQSLVSMINLANSYAAMGRHADARKLNEETLALLTAKHGPHHPPTLLTMANLAGNLAELGRHAEALKLYEEALALQRAKMGLGSPYTLSTMRRLAGVYHVVGRNADSVKTGEEAVALMRKKFGPDHRETLGTMLNLANSYGAVGRLDDALKLNEETFALMKGKLGPSEASTLMAMNNLANCYAASGRYADALKLRQEKLALQQAKLGADHAETLRTMLLVGRSHIELKDYAAAEAILLDRQARVERNAKDLPPGWKTVAIPRFIQLYEAWGKPDEAEKWRAQAAAGGGK